MASNFFIKRNLICIIQIKLDKKEVLSYILIMQF